MSGSFRGFRQFTAAALPLVCLEKLGAHCAGIQFWESGTLVLVCDDMLDPNRSTSGEETIAVLAPTLLPLQSSRIVSWTGALPFVVYW